jgi:hypothetical protein
VSNDNTIRVWMLSLRLVPLAKGQAPMAVDQLVSRTDHKDSVSVK